MKTKALFAGGIVFGLLGLALVVGAQGPRGPRGGEGFGMGGPGEMMGGGGRCTAPCAEYQFAYKRVNVQPFLVNGNASPITTTTSGIIARNSNGSTYNQVTLSGGPWGGQSGPREIISIRNLDPSVMMSYIENVTNKTYQQHAIKQTANSHKDGARPDWPGPGKGPKDGGPLAGPGGTPPTRTTVTNYAISDSTYICPSAEKISMTHTIQLPGSGGSATITSNEVICTALGLVVEKDRSDPRFGTSTYTLSNYMPAPNSAVSFTPDSSFTLSKDKSSGGRPGPGGRQFGPGH